MYGFPFAPFYDPGPSLQVLVPPQATPLCYNRQTPNPEQSRRFFLDRCLFELVDSQPHLELTDPRLLGWYLGLPAEDRMIIQAEGGLHRFLQRHPTLELSPHHVYVKCKRVQSPRPTPAGLSLNSCGTPPANQVLNIYSNNDPGTMASVCLDATLERCRQNRNNERWNLVTQDQTANFTFADVGPLQSEWSTIQNNPPEIYSSDCLQMDGTESNWSHIQSSQLLPFNCPLVPENGTKKKGRDCTTRNNEDPINKDENGARVGLDQAYSRPVTPNGEALSPSSELIDSDQSLTKRCSEENGPFPVPRLSTCDVMVGTESAQCVSAFTQTDDPVAAHKHINTEVCMADLDYVAVEFFKLKAQEKLKKRCDCVQRAQQAELSLLALQYTMCRQHCWSLCCSAAGGDQGNAWSGDVNQRWPTDPPANIQTVLNKLESDYKELRGRILTRVPLEQLRPLSVDCSKITSATYIPAQIIASIEGRHMSQSRASSHENEFPNDCQRKAKQVTQQNRARTAVGLVPRASGAFCDAQTLVETQTAASKEPTTGDTWYDAKEDLKPGPAAAGKAPQLHMGMVQLVSDDVLSDGFVVSAGSANEETRSAAQYTSTLPHSGAELIQPHPGPGGRTSWEA